MRLVPLGEKQRGEGLREVLSISCCSTFASSSAAAGRGNDGDGFSSSWIWHWSSAGEVSTDTFSRTETEAAVEAVNAGETQAGTSGSVEVCSVAATSLASCTFIGGGEAESEATDS
jgi:hypothetical protein